MAPGDPAATAAASEVAPGVQPGLVERLESRVVIYWLLTDVIRALLLGAALVAGAEYWHQQEPRPWLPEAARWFAVALVALAVVAPPLAHARWRFGVDDRMLRMRYGILFVEERHVPIQRMQHVDLTRGPIERLFGLATLVVYTAGNEGSSFRVPGLGRRRAEALRDRILRLRGDDQL